MFPILSHNSVSTTKMRRKYRNSSFIFHFFYIGAFPLPESSRMTDEERAKFLPSVRTFIGVLEKDTLDPEEINELLVQARDITPTEGLSDGFFGGCYDGS